MSARANVVFRGLQQAEAGIGTSAVDWFEHGHALTETANPCHAPTTLARGGTAVVLLRWPALSTRALTSPVSRTQQHTHALCS